MGEDIKVFVGLDVHKDSIVIGVAEAGRSPARLLGKIGHDTKRLAAHLDRLGKPEQVHVVYEAGPTGYGLYRFLIGRGHPCQVIAPSRTPKRPGDRVKTDTRDGLGLAEFSRAGQLTAVHIPSPEDEAVRDVSRAREDAVRARTQARQQIKSFLLRHERRFSGKTSWTKSHYAWMGAQNFGDTNAQIAFTEYWLAVQACDQRVARLDKAVRLAAQGWRFEPVVQALVALRGIDMVSALGLVAEINDINRFAHPRQLMSYLGLTSKEHSSGARTERGAITRAGNTHARRLLVEASWHYRHGARIGRQAHERQRELPEPIRATAWKAQQRLNHRFNQLNARGLQRNKIAVAVARELAGFIWAIARQAMPPDKRVNPIHP